jgi:endonuclease-3
MATTLLERFEGNVPKTMEELIQLSGVGRKTASVVMNQAFGLPAIAVDTHVKRVSKRLGWTQSDNPEKVEEDLKRLLPQEHWAAINGRLIFHGRKICKARKPLCEECFLKAYCAFYLNR